MLAYMHFSNDTCRQPNLAVLVEIKICGPFINRVRLESTNPQRRVFRVVIFIWLVGHGGLRALSNWRNFSRHLAENFPAATNLQTQKKTTQLKKTDTNNRSMNPTKKTINYFLRNRSKTLRDPVGGHGETITFFK